MPAEPLFLAEFTLTRADALAWEQRKRPLSAREKLILFSLIALAGAAYAWLENDLPIWFLLLPRLVQFALLVAGFLGLWRLGLTLAARSRAARSPTQTCRFEDRGDRFLLHRGGGLLALPLSAVQSVTLAPRHVFLVTADGPVILPRSAFESQAQAESCAALWAERIRALGPVDLRGVAD